MLRGSAASVQSLCHVVLGSRVEEVGLSAEGLDEL